MKHKITQFSPQGDTAIVEWEETDEKSIEKARGAFKAARADGYATVAVADGGATTVETFDPTIDEIILLRPIAGGCC